MGYRVEVRDAALNRIGIIDTWISMDLVIRYCQQGTWQMLVAAGTPQADLLQKGGGVAIFQDGVDLPIMTGQIESFQHYWTSAQHTSLGSLYFGGKCDNKLAYNRLAFPDPTKDATQQWQATDNGRAVSGLSGHLVWDELNKAMGTAAVPSRRAAGVVIGNDVTIGNTVADNLQWDVIGSKLESWIDTKTTGYRFLYDPNTKKINLNLFTPRDRSKEVRFSKELGNLREFTWSLTAPTVTRVIVACQGTGKGRYLYQQIDSASEAEWGLSIEQFLDRRDLPLKADPTTGLPIKADLSVTDAQFTTAKQAVLDAATEALNTGAKNGNFQIYPVDTEQVKFGRDYFVGDVVTISIDGVEYTDIVREVSITVDQGGDTETVTPTIGEQGSGNPLNLYKTVFDMREKLRKLEARM
ncbi:siphovirus ReqiPepy6 Gp37-like family protein [Streptomyces sp. NBC_01751]|uniref:siphovirus ReqiPepy6 Gp37-like family protein n=1 Tax=Streptomyces sp. NBC_01751 TaxID=2975929 RepID=UPI002DD87DEF|nr:siphovirus ReqiPepy6 Gp37-like family protein [Streptomyces sp. NBC_01751]WSD24553.1 siphovirus ReqiPepy6 Gp37-like family protein [Streptomyces sp. NBC_01751]